MADLRFLLIFAPEKESVMYRRFQYNELKSRIEDPRDKIQGVPGGTGEKMSDVRWLMADV